MTPLTSARRRQFDANWEYGQLSARVYELDKPVGSSLNGDVEFYTRRLAGVDGPVLEPAVGTGRILIPLLRQGLDVIGYDTSDHMLDICRANLQAAALATEVFSGDMAAYRQPDAFAAIVVPTGSVILLPDRASVADALRNMHDSLRPGGRLFIDLPPPNPSPDTGQLRSWWDGDSELLTLRNMYTEVDTARQKITTWLRYELWRDGRLVDTQLQLGGMQWFGIPEFSGMLRDAGFAAVSVFGDYREATEPSSASAIWTFEATRAA